MAEEPTTTLWLGNLDPRVTRRLLYELGIQVRGALHSAPPTAHTQPRPPGRRTHCRPAQVAAHASRASGLAQSTFLPDRLQAAQALHRAPPRQTACKPLIAPPQQAGPVISISLPVAVDGSNRGYGFVEFESVESAAFAVRLFRGLTLFGRPVRTDFGGKKAGGPQQQHGGMAAAPVQY